MKSDLNKLVEEIVKELMGGSFPAYSVDGAPSFRGGPYGAGHKKQLANTLDPSVKAMEDQEQAELNQNVEDQIRINRNFKKGVVPPYKMQDVDSDPELKRDMAAAKKYDPVVAERNDADMFYTHLPGFPSMNALESPVQHVPNENLPVDTLRAGGQDGTEEYLIDDIIDELEREGKPGNYVQEQGAQGGGNFWNQQKSELPPFYVDPDDQEHALEMGHMQEPSAEYSPPATHGSIMFPRKFVPDEMPQESDMLDQDLDGIADGIDLNQPPELQQRVKENKMKTEAKRQKHKSTRHAGRYGEKEPSSAQISRKFKVAKRALIELADDLNRAGLEGGSFRNGSEDSSVKQVFKLLLTQEKLFNQDSAVDESAVDEEYKSKAQQGYFHAKAEEGDPEFQKLAAEFDSETSPEEFANLPARAPKKEALNADKLKSLVIEEIRKQIKEKK